MKPGKINEYICRSCGNTIITIDIHIGITPFIIACPKCKAMATSRFYNVAQQQEADLIWYAPTLAHLQDDHVKQGGLIIESVGKPLERVRLQNQPNEATCLITSFAMVLNVPVIELINQVGHDGMSVIFTDNNPPTCFRGHHIQEMIFAAFERGYAVIEFQPIPTSQSQDCVIQHRDFELCFEKALMLRNGVLVGKRRGRNHAVAWDSYMHDCYDGNEKTIYEISEFEIRTFYAIVPMTKSNQKEKS